jgi:hypothetical protein
MENNTFTIISEIARRFNDALQISGRHAPTVMSVIMDIEAFHNRTPLRLEELRDGSLLDLGHDVGIIAGGIERSGPNKGKLLGDKIPRNVVINETARKAFPFND